MNVSNYTLYGIQSSAERYFWAAYYIFVLLSSIIGDTLILYASIHKDAFKLNKFIVSVLQNIAVSDLIISITVFLPKVTSLLTNNWALGIAMCYASVYISIGTLAAAISFIAVMSTSKFLLLKYPLRASQWTKKRGLQVCASIWVLCILTFILTFLVVRGDDVQFDFRIYSCDYGFNAEVWEIIVPIWSLTFQILPCCITFGTTIPTLKYLVDASKSARRVQGSIPWQGAMTVTLTAVVYCISNVPLFVYCIGYNFIERKPSSLFHVQFYRVAAFVGSINVMANFYIYALTIRSFRRFLNSEIQRLVSVTRQDSGNRTSEGKLSIADHLNPRLFS